MAERQVLLCPVCGKSGPLPRFSIDAGGSAAQERTAYTPKIALLERRPKSGQLFWTHHAVPLQVLVALRQQMVEALGRLDEAIAEAASDE